MRLFQPNLPPVSDNNFHSALIRLFRELAQRSDMHSYGYMAGREGRATAAPTTGKWALGDYIWNSNPSELGTTPNKYWIRGWVCLVGGEPGTWVQDRGLTGN
jgi:hypothetical protein